MCKAKKGVQHPTQEEQRHTFQRYLVILATQLLELHFVLRTKLSPNLVMLSPPESSVQLPSHFQKWWKICQRLKSSHNPIRFLQYQHKKQQNSVDPLITGCWKVKSPRIAGIRLSIGLYHPSGFRAEPELSPKGVFAAQQRCSKPANVNSRRPHNPKYKGPRLD